MTPSSTTSGIAPSFPHDDRRAERHRLDDDKTERFRPVDRENQCCGVAQEIRLLVLADLADDIRRPAVDMRLHRLAKICRSSSPTLAAILSFMPLRRAISIARSGRLSRDSLPRKAR